MVCICICICVSVIESNLFFWNTSQDLPCLYKWMYKWQSVFHSCEDIVQIVEILQKTAEIYLSKEPHLTRCNFNMYRLLHTFPFCYLLMNMDEKYGSFCYIFWIAFSHILYRCRYRQGSKDSLHLLIARGNFYGYKWMESWLWTGNGSANHLVVRVWFRIDKSLWIILRDDQSIDVRLSPATNLLTTNL